MNPFFVLATQATASLIVFSLLAKWYVAPRLLHLPLEKALVPLLWINVFRYLPLNLFAPGQVSVDIPATTLSLIAYGDLIAGALAFIAILFLTYRIPGAILAVWAFLTAGIADMLVALSHALAAKLYLYPLGFNWYVVAFYVPMIFVSQVMIAYWLLSRRAARHAA